MYFEILRIYELHVKKIYFSPDARDSFGYDGSGKGAVFSMSRRAIASYSLPASPSGDDTATGRPASELTRTWQPPPRRTRPHVDMSAHRTVGVSS